MIILGIALLIIGSLTEIAIVWMTGIVALVVGLVLILSARSAPGGWPPLPVTARGSEIDGTPGPRRKRYGNAGGPETRSMPIEKTICPRTAVMCLRATVTRRRWLRGKGNETGTASRRYFRGTRGHAHR